MDCFSASDALVGFSSTTIHIFRYKKIGRVVICFVFFSGTSNTTTITATLPFASASLGNNNNQLIGVITNSGTGATTPGMVVVVDNSTTVNFDRDRNVTAYTASGTKTFEAMFIYESAT